MSISNNKKEETKVVDATYKNGVLSVRITKKEGEKKKTTILLECAKRGRGWKVVEVQALLSMGYIWL